MSLRGGMLGSSGYNDCSNGSHGGDGSGDVYKGLLVVRER